MTENINSIVDRLLTDTRIVSIMPFLVILVASLSLGIPFADAKNKQPESESEDLSVSPDTATEVSSNDDTNKSPLPHLKISLLLLQSYQTRNLSLRFLQT